MNAGELVLSIGASGDVVTLDTDVMDLRALGRLTMEKASFVEWDAASQQWGVRFASSAIQARGQFEQRAAALAFERQQINQALAAGIIPAPGNC